MAVPIWEGNRWRIRITTNGKTKYFSSNKPGMAGKKEVLKKVRIWEDSDKKTTVIPTVENVWNFYVEDYRNRKGENEQMRTILSVGNNYILPYISNRKISTLKIDDWQNLLNNSKSIDGSPLADKTLKNIKGVINNFIKYSYEHEYIDAYRGTLYVPHGHSKKQKKSLQPEEIKSLLEFEDDHWCFLWHFMVLTGLRPGEAIGLQKGDIELETKTVHISRSINYRGEITPGKNKNSNRTFVLSDAAYDVLLKQLEKTKKYNSIWIFTDPNGKQPIPYIIAKHWNKARKQLGFDYSQYELRHTFISILRNELPEQRIKDLCGHSDSMPTFSVYGHTITTDMYTTADMLNEVFKSKLSL